MDLNNGDYDDDNRPSYVVHSGIPSRTIIHRSKQRHPNAWYDFLLKNAANQFPFPKSSALGKKFSFSNHRLWLKRVTCYTTALEEIIFRHGDETEHSDAWQTCQEIKFRCLGLFRLGFCKFKRCCFSVLLEFSFIFRPSLCVWCKTLFIFLRPSNLL